MEAFGLPTDGWQPPKVPPRKEKRPKQNKKPQPYTEMEPSSSAQPRPSAQDKLDSEHQRPRPYTAESGPSTRPGGQEKLRRERIRALANAGASIQGSGQARAESVPPSYRSMSPAPTFTSLPPYSPGPSGSQPQPAPAESRPRSNTQTKAGNLLSRIGLTSSRSRSLEPEWVMAAPPTANPRPLPAIPHAGSVYRRDEVAGGTRSSSDDARESTDEDTVSDSSTVVGRAY